MVFNDLALVFTREINGVKKELFAYKDPKQIWLVPQGISNSAGNLALHIAGNLQHFIGAVLGESGYVRDREFEFAAKNVDISSVLERLDAASGIVKKTLLTLSPQLQEINFPFPTGDAKLTINVFLLHLLSHLAYHLGQINYHRRLITGINGQTRPVSVKKLLD